MLLNQELNHSLLWSAIAIAV